MGNYKSCFDKLTSGASEFYPKPKATRKILMWMFPGSKRENSFAKKSEATDTETGL